MQLRIQLLLTQALPASNKLLTMPMLVKPTLRLLLEERLKSLQLPVSTLANAYQQLVLRLVVSDVKLMNSLSYRLIHLLQRASRMR
jgi:hypothetical protein